ncbi:MAG: diaminopimelate epimerase [Candidatus Omnitrophota bacterium]
MRKIEFTKMVASGNDFVLIDNRGQGRETGSLKQLAKLACDRRYGAGADGLLFLEKAKMADIRMRIFNADGSEAEMCGNGARCAALYLSQNVSLRAPKGRSNPGFEIASSGFALLAMTDKFKIETKAGVIESIVKGDNVKIKLTDPKDIKLDIPIKVNNRALAVNYINTGVPHAVIFVEGLNNIGVAELGRQVRRHKKFTPAGTNVNFVEVLNNDSIKIRTYERGVEDETLACGTGAVASALLFSGKAGIIHKINVITKSGEALKVYFERAGANFKNVWLEGKAKIVYTGVFNV